MEREKDTTNNLLETIRKEMVSIVEDGSDRYDNNLNIEQERKCEDNVDLSEVCSASISDPSKRSAILDAFNISNIDGDIRKLQCNLDDSYNLFQAIGENFENINFGCLKNRVKDLHLNERSVNSIKTIVNDLQHSFDEKYMENRLADLTKEVNSKFRNHTGEFGDIPEISEFFRACSKLEQGLEKLSKQRDYCMNLQKRMIRVAEASYDRVNDIQDKISGIGNNPQDKEVLI